ncbi:hypothetical protein A9D12_02230 [Erythrobacter neustonensis]|uniref:Uncharacterized protein n=2 Tax=Erythrobacter neustonensis TaxID=1112 RepID=A0A192D1E7_9SPHN|nr:hypothetical protein A9D12_02230 [Erythrobacter neustonensis]
MVEAVSAASVEPIYAGSAVPSTAFCNFVSTARKNRRIPRFLSNKNLTSGPATTSKLHFPDGESVPEAWFPADSSPD